jgi:hypothetical protein
MSSGYIRNMVRGWAASSPTPFYDTINKEHTPNDPVWFTIEFQVEGSARDTYCGDESEDGVIELVFCGQPGNGDGAIIAAAEAEGKRLLLQSDPAEQLSLVRAMPPEEFSAGDGDRWYRVVVGIEYQCHS